MKFLVDMALSPKTVSLLRELGYEAFRVNEVLKTNSKDSEIMEYALKNNMVLITADLDFGYILAYTQNNKPSFIIFRLKKPLVKYINNLLSLYINDLKEALEEGSLVIIEDDKIRVRKLPI